MCWVVVGLRVCGVFWWVVLFLWVLVMVCGCLLFGVVFVLRKAYIFVIGVL